MKHASSRGLLPRSNVASMIVFRGSKSALDLGMKGERKGETRSFLRARVGREQNLPPIDFALLAPAPSSALANPSANPL